MRGTDGDARRVQAAQIRGPVAHAPIAPEREVRAQLEDRFHLSGCGRADVVVVAVAPGEADVPDLVERERKLEEWRDAVALAGEGNAERADDVLLLLDHVPGATDVRREPLAALANPLRSRRPADGPAAEGETRSIERDPRLAAPREVIDEAGDARVPDHIEVAGIGGERVAEIVAAGFNRRQNRGFVHKGSALQNVVVRERAQMRVIADIVGERFLRRRA